MSYGLNSLKEGYIGDYIGIVIGFIKGDTRSLSYSPHIRCLLHPRFCGLESGSSVNFLYSRDA